MITIYSEKEIFENIILFSEEYPNLNKLFVFHAEVCLNISDDEMDNELKEDSVILEYTKVTGGRHPIALKEYFEDVYENNEIVACKPRSVFFLNVSKEKAIQLQEDFGVVVHGSSIMDDFFFCDPKEDVLEEKTKSKWSDVFLGYRMPPMNALVINDRFLFKNEENNSNIGTENIVRLLDEILPKTLAVVFHITILVDKDKCSCHFDGQRLEKRIKELRSYSIFFELFFLQKGLHERILVSNYLYSFFDPSLAIFSNKSSLVRQRTKYLISSVFYTNVATLGKTKFELLESDLIEIKKSKLKGIKTVNRLMNDV